MVFRAMDFGSFTSIWYWIVLAVFWVGVLCFPMGISVGRIDRARHHETDQQTLVTLGQICASSWIVASERTAMMVTVLLTFVLGVLLMLAFGYQSVFATGLIFFYVPGLVVGYFTRQCAARIHQGGDVNAALSRLVLQSYAVALPSLLITAWVGGVMLVRGGLT